MLKAALGPRKRAGLGRPLKRLGGDKIRLRIELEDAEDIRLTGEAERIEGFRIGPASIRREGQSDIGPGSNSRRRVRHLLLLAALVDPTERQGVGSRIVSDIEKGRYSAPRPKRGAVGLEWTGGDETIDEEGENGAVSAIIVGAVSPAWAEGNLDSVTRLGVDEVPAPEPNAVVSSNRDAAELLAVVQKNGGGSIAPSSILLAEMVVQGKGSGIGHGPAPHCPVNIAIVVTARVAVELPNFGPGRRECRGSKSWAGSPRFLKPLPLSSSIRCYLAL